MGVVRTSLAWRLAYILSPQSEFSTEEESWVVLEEK